MRIAYLHCFAGISGDMLLGALLDAGVPDEVLQDAVSALGLNASLRIEKIDRSGISSTKVHVMEGDRVAEHAESHQHGHTHEHEERHQHAATHEHHDHDNEHDHHEHQHGHKHDEHEPKREPKHEHGPKHEHEKPARGHGRSLHGIRELILGSSLNDRIKSFAVHTFELLGRSEAKIHNVPVERIHFHEVGAVDAIVDIVSAAAGVAYLESNGPIAWWASPVNVGGGMVECAHGTFPVPAPATADLLREMPTYSAHIEKELVTPTGAALLRALMPRFGPQPPMLTSSIGYGAGSRNPKGFPNVLRLSLGNSADLDRGHVGRGHIERDEFRNLTEASSADGEVVMVLETALDDANPQLVAHVAERALAAGALDVMLTPVLMKKGRPGTLITVLAEPEMSVALESLLLRETTTLGIRMHREQRRCLVRRHATVLTEYGALRIKIGSHGGEELNAMPEFEDCRAAAEKHGVPLKQVLHAAAAAYNARQAASV